MMKLIDKAMELLGMPTAVRCAKRSSKWPALRDKHLKENPACIACGDAKRAKEIHHVDPVHYCPERELDPTNLVTLCSEHCHITWGHLGNFKFRCLTTVEDCVEHRNKSKAAHVEYLGFPFDRERLDGLGETK